MENGSNGMIINRDILNNDIIYDGQTKEQICKKINRWKRLLKYKYGLQKGDVVCLIIIEVSVNHIAAMLAAAELGMKLFLTNKPISNETVHATKMGIFGPMDLTIVTETQGGGKPWPESHYLMINRYSKQICMEDELEEILTDEDIPDEIVVNAEDVYLFGSTSGTKKNSRPVFWTHKDVYWMSTNELNQRCKFNCDDVAMHTINMHHLGSMIGFLIPSLMRIKTHYSNFIEADNVEEVAERMIDLGVTDTMVHIIYLPRVLRYLEDNKDRIKKRITFQHSGKPLEQSDYDLCKRAPINFHSLYGSIDIGGVIHNFVDDKSEYIPHRLGELMKNMNIEIDGEYMYVTSPMWNGEKKLLDDKIRFDGKDYFFDGRREQLPDLQPVDFRPVLNDTFDDWLLLYRDGQPDLIIWDHEPIDFNNSFVPFHRLCRKIFFLEKEKFMDATKLSMEQVRAYVENN